MSGEPKPRPSDDVCLGVPGLDEAMGCVPRGSVIIVAGYPGAGKTTLASQFIYEGLRNGEPGLYISFVEPREDFLRNSSKFGMDFSGYESRGLFRYYEALSVSDAEALGDLIQDVLVQVDKMNARRLVIDSVSAIEQLAGDAPRAREITHSALYVGLKRRGVTSVLISEMPVGSETFGVGPEEFIADGIIVMRYSFVKGGVERVMQVRKMRGLAVQLPEMHYVITGSGVEVIVPPSVAQMPSAVRPERAYDLLGITVPEGSGVLIIHDPSIDPIKFTLWALAYPAAAAGLRVRVGSYIHGVSSMAHVFEACRASGDLSDRVSLETFEAQLSTPYEQEMRTLRSDMMFRPDMVIFEGMHLLTAAGPRDYGPLIYRTLVRRAAMRITTFHLYAAPRERAWDVPLSDYYDHVIYMRREGDEIVFESLRTWGSVIPAKPVRVPARAFEGCDEALRYGLRVRGTGVLPSK